MGLPVLLGQCIAMFVASMLVGSLPLMFKSASSGKQLKAVSVLGMGILVGAALTIIIPEGVSTLFESIPVDKHHTSARSEDAVRAIGLSLLSGFALMLLIETLTPHPPGPGDSTPPSTPPTPTTPLNGPPSTDRPNFTHLDSRSPIVPKRMHMHDSSNGDKGCATGGAIRGLNATLGLVIHGAADGIALGASSLSEKGNLGLIVFVAVLVHKGPTALGLTTTLLSLGLDHPGIRKRLMIFSFAAPLGAVITYAIINAFGGNSVGMGKSKGDVDALQWWTGIALLFSGGSFLYVATVIQPLSSTNPEEHEHSHSGPSESHESQLGKYSRIGLLIGGMILPVLLSGIVGDHH